MPSAVQVQSITAMGMQRWACFLYGHRVNTGKYGSLYSYRPAHNPCVDTKALDYSHDGYGLRLLVWRTILHCPIRVASDVTNYYMLG